MTLKKILILFSLVMVFTKVSAEGLAFEGSLTDDSSHKKYDKARIEIAYDEASACLELLILPSIEAMRTDALIDTLWTYGSYYREAPSESTDFFEEKRIFFLYKLEDDKYLDSYTVFSQFIDKQNKDIQQIVIRKFDESGRRMWCASINADSAETDSFFNLIKEARKNLKFRRLSKVMERPDPNVKHRPVFEDSKVREKNHMHGGNPYNSRY